MRNDTVWQDRALVDRFLTGVLNIWLPRPLWLVDALYQWQQHQGGSLSRQEVGRQFVYRDDKQANVLAPVETQCEWLRQIGFQQVDCYFKWFELAVFGGVRAWGSKADCAGKIHPGPSSSTELCYHK